MSVRGVGVGSVVLSAGCGDVAGGSGPWWERLVGVSAPVVELPFAPGEPVVMLSLAELARRDSLAVVFYSGGEDRSGGVGIDTGARLEGWREREPELEELGYHVVGVSEQSSLVQVEFALERLFSLFTFLSDGGLLLADELGLPTRMSPAGGRVYESLTMLIRDGLIWWVFHPLVNPVIDAEIAIDRIRGSRG